MKEKKPSNPSCVLGYGEVYQGENITVYVVRLSAC